MRERPTSDGDADARVAAVNEPELYELDGIPLAFLPMTGPTILTVAFGVGRAHEPPVRAGMTHLLEHLLMTRVAADLDVALDHSNGATEPFRVTFTFRGQPRDVSRFLRELCRAIEHPPLDRMHREAVVLRTEAAGRASGGLGFESIYFRTGLQGIGVLRLPELFLDQLDEAVLRSWLERHFTAGNAAIWIAGTLPDDLFVSLPPGERTPVPPYREIDGLRTPTIVGADGPGFGVSFRSRRGVATMTAYRILDRWLRRALRVDNALGYDVGSDYLPVGPDEAVAATWATCLPEKRREVGRTLLEVIDDLAARGPTDQELADVYARYVESHSDPMGIPPRLDAHVRDVLMGAPAWTTAGFLGEQARLEPAHVLEAFRRIRDTMLLVAPADTERPQRPFEPYPGPLAEAIGPGRTFAINAKVGRNPFRRVAVPTLVLSDAGAVVRDASGTPLTAVPWAHAVAVVRRADGARLLLARDGFQVVIHPDEWKDGASAIALVDRYAPPELVVRTTG